MTTISKLIPSGITIEAPLRPNRRSTTYIGDILSLVRVVSRLTVVSREAKEEVPCEGLSTNAREYFTRTNLVKIKNAITGKPSRLALYNSR